MRNSTLRDADLSGARTEGLRLQAADLRGARIDPTLWHVTSGGQTYGPYTTAQISHAVAAGQLRGDSLVWSAGMEGWSPIARVPRLAALFPPPPPPTPER